MLYRLVKRFLSQLLGKVRVSGSGQEKAIYGPRVLQIDLFHGIHMRFSSLLLISIPNRRFVTGKMKNFYYFTPAGAGAQPIYETNKLHERPDTRRSGLSWSRNLNVFSLQGQVCHSCSISSRSAAAGFAFLLSSRSLTKGQNRLRMAMTRNTQEAGLMKK